MVLKQKMGRNRKIICGKGYCACHNKKYVRGKGFMDTIKSIVMPAINMLNENKDTIKSGVEAIGHIAKISDSTKTIAQTIMNRRKLKHTEKNNADVGIQGIIDKINAFKMGSGFAYV